MSIRPTIRGGWGLGQREWVLYIDPALAPTPADAYEVPTDPDSDLLGLYGETYHDTWPNALSALADWYKTIKEN